jgi:sigma-B regulation protein RsbU (phosphoserine phosphatase)
MKNTFYLIILATCLTLTNSCKKDEKDATTTMLTNEQQVEVSLNGFVSNLVATPPTSADLSDRVKQYLQSNPSYFFGATVTLLDSAEIATDSPYWYRSADSLLTTSLMDTAYNINNQTWLRQAIDSGYAIWTAPYFDTGGGNILMKTRAVPVIVNGKTIAVATTDLAL